MVGLDISLMQPRFSMKGKGLIASSDENGVFPLFAFSSLPQAISFFFCQVHRFLQLFPTLLHTTDGFCFQKHAGISTSRYLPAQFPQLQFLHELCFGLWLRFLPLTPDRSITSPAFVGGEPVKVSNQLHQFQRCVIPTSIMILYYIHKH